jgi:ribonuclease HII
VYHRRFFAPVAAARERHQPATTETVALVTATQTEIEISANI